MSYRFARASVLGGVAGVSVSVGGFLSNVIVARSLGVEGAGAVAYFVWLALFIAPILDLGASAAVGRFVPELRGRSEADMAERLAGYLLRRLLASLALAAAAATVVAVAANLATRYLALPAANGTLFVIWPLVAACAALQVLGVFAFSHLRGRQAFGVVACLAGASLVLQVAAVALGSALFGIPGAVAGHTLSLALPALGALHAARRGGGIGTDLRLRVRRYALYAWAANVANAFVWSRVELFFLERSWGAGAVGIFSVALMLTNLATQAPVMLTTAVLPFLSERSGRGERDQLHSACAMGTRLLALLVFPCCLGMAAVMPALLPLIYGEAFRPAVPAAVVLVCAAAVSATTVVATSLVHAVERVDFIFLSALAGAVFAVLAGFALVPAFGVMGAAAARASIQLMLVALGLWFIISRLRCPMPFAALARLLAASMACAAAAFACVLAFRGATAVAVAVPAGAVAYLLALRLFRAFLPEDLAVMDRLAAELPGPLRRIAKALIRFVAGRGSPNRLKCIG